MTDSDVYAIKSCQFDENVSKLDSELIENLESSIDGLSSTSYSSSTSSVTQTIPILKSCRKSPNISKRRVLFDSVDIFYFDRVQGNTCVPCQGGYTLGMASAHSSFERYPLQVFHKKRRHERHRYLLKKCLDGKLDLSFEQFNFLKQRLNVDNPSKLNSCLPTLPIEENENSNSDGSSSFASSSSDSYICPGESSSSDELEEDRECIRKLDDLHILNAISLKKRKLILKRAGVSKIDDDEKFECERIRQSRTVCGCDCPNGICYPSSCQCALNGISCQVDRASFPCACMLPNGCANPIGRIKFDQAKARTHYLHTRMRLEMEEGQKHPPDDVNTFRKRILDSGGDEDNHLQSQRLRIDSGGASRSLETSEDDRFLADFNTTLSGGCRDCQNDRYVNVLMQEWTSSDPAFYATESSQEESADDCSVHWMCETVDSGYYSSPDETIIQPSPEHIQQYGFVQMQESHLYHTSQSTSVSSNYNSPVFDNETYSEPETDLDNIFEEFPKTDFDHNSSTNFDSQPLRRITEIASPSPTAACKLDPISCFLPPAKTLNPQNLIPSPDFYEMPVTSYLLESSTPRDNLVSTNAYAIQGHSAEHKNNAIESS